MNASLQVVSLDLSRAEALGGVLQALSTQVSLINVHNAFSSFQSTVNQSI